jgi:hypothetical protein
MSGEISQVQDKASDPLQDTYFPFPDCIDP